MTDTNRHQPTPSDGNANTDSDNDAQRYVTSHMHLFVMYSIVSRPIIKLTDKLYAYTCTHIFVEVKHCFTLYCILITTLTYWHNHN
jgi:hypothetical protein